ncbi:pectinesterase family protein [Brevundimonas goettingensis]|uniref:Pectin esterase n=1 Tax=Brevundimonas goettingensis TaxID=2774190 RepID=A0A975C1D3_9CAUL|nr:pectinesterase family protein [Brevundimonas goettingensis]QTC92026.1 pectin esterase [Brevundimonas goettingensis]
MTSVVSRRLILGALAASGLASAARAAPAGFDAAVVKPSQGRAPAGAAVYPDLTSAIAAAPADGARPFRIWIGPGIHEGQVVVDKPFVRLIGASRTGSVINHLAASGLAGPDGRNWGTTRSATLFVRAADFRAENLTLNNAFEGLAEMTKLGGLRSHDGAGPQGVALMLDRGSERSVIRDCDILGYQDTLFANVGTALFERCLIVGSYDFIFGAGRVWFEGCEIRSRPRPGETTDKLDQGYIVAPSTPIDQPFGFVFHRCRLTKEAGTARASVFLGRPWRPTTAFPDGRYGDPRFVAAASYLDCWMDDHIAPEGWTEMWFTGRDGNPRTMLQPEDVRFSTHGSYGPGAAAFARGRTLSDSEAAAITRAAVIRDLR